MNTPVFDPDDPRLTAYALGEGSPAERDAVEQLLAASPEARAEVEQTAALARDLETEYRRENEAYWASRPVEPAPGKVVPFPSNRRQGPGIFMAHAWKIAAVVLALGALVPLALWRTPLPPTVALDSPRPTGANPAPPPAALPVESTPAAGSVAKTGRAMETTAQDSAVAPTTLDTEGSLAMDKDRPPSDEIVAPSTAARRDVAAATTYDAAKPSAHRAEAPPMASVPGAAAGSGSGTISPVEQIGRSLVRIRTADGLFVGGVVVTSDGSILAAQPLPPGETRPAVILADGREISALVTRNDTGLCRLQIDGQSAPAVTFATKAPSGKEPVIIASTDRRTGETRFSRANAAVSGGEVRARREERSSGDETNFVFDSSSELLATASAPLDDKAAARMKTTTRSAAEVESLLRPFTAAERDFLQAPRRDARH